MDAILFGELDPNLALVIIFAMMALVVLVMVYYMTIVKVPRLLTDFVKLLEKGIDLLAVFFRSLL